MHARAGGGQHRGGQELRVAPQAALYFYAVPTWKWMRDESWTAPYLAGLAALAWQVNPAIQPKEAVQLWRETATRPKAGPVVNPAAFIEAVKARVGKKP